MKFGHFDDPKREYVIETPATPLPWINYLGNDGYFRLISNTCGGYSFYRDAKLRRITRFRYNNVPADLGGLTYYIKEGGTIWNPGFLPTKTALDHYKCRHGMGYTIFESDKNQLKAELTCFVPLNQACEINRLKLKNDSSAEKKVQLYSAVEWCLWNAVDDAQNFQRNLNIAEVEVIGSTLYHKTEYRERRNHYAFLHVYSSIDGFDTDRDTFLGQFNGWDTPQMVLKGTSGNSIASGWYPIASHRIDLTLQPGEEKIFVFLLGYCENDKDHKWEKQDVINKEPARKLIDHFSDENSVQAAFDELQQYWNDLLQRFQIQSSDEKLDRMVNIWNQYQCMVTFNMSRSASYYESGTGRGMGFRDSCQDLLGFVHLIPSRARERILDIAAIQFEDGSTYHQYQPLTKNGNGDVGSGFNDDPLWLVACTAAYIKETGDASILEEPVMFDTKPGSEKPLFEHLRRSVNYTINHKGPHDLPLIGRADWNDCLNLNCFSETPGDSFQTTANFESGKAESIFIAAMFVKYGREYAEICKRFGNPEEGTKILQETDRMEKAVEKSGWDGEWFLRAYDAFSHKVGSHENDEGQIFIEPQGFCVMAKIGLENGMAQKAMDSVENRLVCKYGVELLNPPYTRYHVELGEISSYPPSYKENGSVFCHNNPWIVLAYTELKNGNKAFETYKRTCPAYLQNISEIHKTEAYCYSQTIAGHFAAHYGEAKNSWLTGTAAWSFAAVSQGILGVQPDYDGLRINPCLPDELDGFELTRHFRGCDYHVTVKKSGTKELVVDGKSIKGNLIPFTKGCTSCEVTVNI